MISMQTRLRFELPPDLVATAPPEERGLRRDQVRLLAASPRRIAATRFDSLAAELSPGDLLVVNTSPTMAAAVDGTMRGEPVGIHLSTLHPDGTWVVEVRRSNRSGPILGAMPNEVIRLDGAGLLRLVEPADGREVGSVRLWRARVDVVEGVRRFTERLGRPIRYAYVDRDWPLSMYQTVFADPTSWPGSAEMPSAGRPFTAGVTRDLRHRGVQVVSIRLDTGVSSQEADEHPYPERFEVSADTAAAVNVARQSGRRVVAVGTTVARALETVADSAGLVEPASGWTDLVLGPSHPARVVSGLITGFHPPEASHLDLLEAVAGRELVAATYESALDERFLWHEFGDSCLLLPDVAAVGLPIAA